MVEMIKQGVYLVDGQPVAAAEGMEAPDAAREKTMAYGVLRAHDRSDDPKKLRLKLSVWRHTSSCQKAPRCI